MSETPPLPNRAKKGVGLSGVTAGNTALCTVGRTGNDLHYRGYDILDVAEHLRVRGDRLPAGARQAADARRTGRLQGQAERAARPAGRGEGSRWRRCPPPSHPMDVMRTGGLGAGLRAAGEGRSEPCPARATSPTG